MKIMYFDDFRLGIVKGDSVVDVTEVVKDIPHLSREDLMAGLIERFDVYETKLEAAAAAGARSHGNTTRFKKEWKHLLAELPP